MSDLPATASCPRCGSTVPRLIDGLCPGCLARNVRTGMEALLTPPFQTDELAPEIEGIEIQEPLGAGGMGLVFRGVRESDGEPLAVKVLPRGLSGDPERRERFQREAAALSALDHSGIVRILAAGETLDGRLYLAMELVEGCDLRRLLRTGKLEPARALDIVSKIAAALGHAHSRGIVHRDVKPGNILIGDNGVVKVADFGIARAVTGEAGSWTLTQTREAFGTPYYMAPELAADASAASPASDVYALGVLLYEMLTGRVPMGNFTPASKIAGVDAQTDHLISSALADAPASRPGSMQAFAEKLASSQHRLSRRAARRKWKIVSLSAAALLLTAAGGVWAGWKHAAPPPGPQWRSPASATRSDPWVNSLGMKFVPLPDSPDALMCIWETRRRDCAAFAKEIGEPDEPDVSLDYDVFKLNSIEKGREVWLDIPWQNPGFPQTDDDPAVGLTTPRIHVFCRWLTLVERMQGRLTSPQHYRLPSTTEWDRARAAGPEVPGNLPGPEVVDDGWPADAERVTARDAFLRTAPVGSFPPNAGGFFDLTGNVSELCLDVSTPRPGQPRLNYQARQTWRGESWRALTIPVRRQPRMLERRSDTGFRLVLDLGGKDAPK